MRIIDVTWPLYEGIPLGTVFPNQAEFKVEVTAEFPSHRSYAYQVWCEQGTRLCLPSMMYRFHGDKEKLDEVDLSKLVLRDTVVLDVPKGPNQPVTGRDIEDACSKADYREGDAVLVRTGWGDDERYLKLGEDYVFTSPYYADDACQKLVEIMTRKKSDLFCYDTANIHDYADVKATWCQMKPRPKPWPSPEAKEYLAKMAKEPIMETIGSGESWGAMRLIKNRIMLHGGLVNCSQIKKQRVKLIALPLRVKGGVMAPCHTVAIEE